MTSGRPAPVLGPRVAGIVAAAGASRRMGQAKALLQFEGRSFLEVIVGTMLDAGLAEVCVVLPPAAEDEVARLAHDAFAGNGRVRRVTNRWMERGYSGALQSALAELPPADAWALTPVDAPFTTPELLCALVDALFTAPQASAPCDPRSAGDPAEVDVALDGDPCTGAPWAVVPVTRDGPGHPVLFHARCASLLWRAHEGSGPRGVLAGLGDRRRLLPWPDPRIACDLNTPAALRIAGLPLPPGTEATDPETRQD